MMDHRPVTGAEALSPPNAQVAQACLDEVDQVARRREARVDRRAAAKLDVAEAIVISVFVTLCAFSMGLTPANSPFLMVLAVYLVWIQLATELRDTFGGVKRTRRAIWGVTLLAVVLIVVLVLAFVYSARAEPLPPLLGFTPGVITLAVHLVPALRRLRHAERGLDRTARRPLTAGERWVTIAIGVMMSAVVCVPAVGSEIVELAAPPVLMLTLIGWWIAGRVSESLPAPGAVWAWPQWSAFALSGGLVVGATIVRLIGIQTSLAPLTLAFAGFALILSVGSALLEGRDG